MGRSFQILFATLLLAALFVGLNMAAGRALRGVRLDATEGRIFTLTAGSRNIAKSPEEPVKLSFFYSGKLAQGRPSIQMYAQRVREMLEEFARASGGKISLEVVDPEPFSEAEDRAVQAGLRGVPVTQSENLYFGLVGTNAVETRETIEFFNPEKERFLEYDIARLIYSLAHPTRKVVGLITGLSIEGGFSMDPRTRQPRQTPAWRIADQIKETCTLRNLGQPEEIPADVDVLMVVHPKNLPDATLFAIDQFVMKGGKMIAFVDPLCENDDGGAMQGMPGADRASNLDKLLNAWGVEVVPGRIAADSDLGMRVLANNDPTRPEAITYVAWLKVGREHASADNKKVEPLFSKEDSVIGQLEDLNFASAGIIRARPAPGAPKEGETAPPAGPAATISPLVSTTSSAMEMPVELIGPMPDPKALLRSFVPGKDPLVLAARLSGKVPSAFPAGAPPKEGEPAEAAKPAAISESKDSINVILVADCDMLSDPMWARQQNFFGQTFTQVIADNGAFVSGAIENMAGGTDLIGVRARREAARPFTLVESMQKKAEANYRAEEEMLQKKITDANDRILQLSQQQGDKQGTILLTPEVQAEVDKLKQEVLQSRKQLRQVQRNLRKDIEDLGSQLKLINIGVMPAIVCVGALCLGIVRRARRRQAWSSDRGAKA